MSLFQLLAKGVENASYESDKTPSQFFPKARQLQGPFAFERVPLDSIKGGSLAPGEKVVITIPRKADLLWTVLLKGNGTGDIRGAIQQMRFLVGGAEIESFDGDWLRKHTLLQGQGAENDAKALAASHCAILPFFFCDPRDTSAAFPLISTPFYECSLELEFGHSTFESFSLEAIMINVSPSERTTLAQKPFDVPVRLVRTVKRNLTPPSHFSPTSTQRLRIDEINGLVSSVLISANLKLESWEPLEHIDLLLNAQSTIPLSTTAADLRAIEPVLRAGPDAAQFPQGNYLISFSTNTRQTFPKGTMNFSAVDSKEVVLKTKASATVAPAYDSLKIFLVTHNVLKIGEGKACLAWV